MNQLLSNPTRICGKCHQELPCEAFYVSQKSQYRDCYCKKCRAESSRLRRKQQPHSSIPDNPKAYLVITLVKNREVRIALIRHAKQVVNESIARKRRRLKEEVMSDQSLVISGQQLVSENTVTDHWSQIHGSPTIHH